MQPHQLLHYLCLLLVLAWGATSQAVTQLEHHTQYSLLGQRLLPQTVLLPLLQLG
jgi:hypothetical protein